MSWKRRLVALASVILGVSSCSSTAGPFVTNISSDGRGGLVIEKCMAKFDPWMSTVGNSECRNTNIQLRTP